MSRWFIEISGEQIEGPFSEETIQARLDAGQLQLTDRIWGRMMEEWQSIGWWKGSLKDLAKQEKEIVNPEVWHYALAGNSFGPLAWADLIQNLKSTASSSVEQLFQAMIWTKGMREWASILEFHELLDAIGVNKRESARAAIQGRAVIKSQGHTYLAPLRSISEGGFGCDSISGVIAGENVVIEIQSDEFKAPILARAQVRYVMDRIVGMKFTQISTEARGLIVQYIRRSPNRQMFFLKSAA